MGLHVLYVLAGLLTVKGFAEEFTVIILCSDLKLQFSFFFFFFFYYNITGMEIDEYFSGYLLFSLPQLVIVAHKLNNQR